MKLESSWRLAIEWLLIAEQPPQLKKQVLFKKILRSSSTPVPPSPSKVLTISLKSISQYLQVLVEENLRVSNQKSLGHKDESCKSFHQGQYQLKLKALWDFGKDEQICRMKTFMKITVRNVYLTVWRKHQAQVEDDQPATALKESFHG